MGSRELRKKKKGLDFFSKKTVNHSRGIYIEAKSLVYALFRNWTSVKLKQYKLKSSVAL